MELSTFYERYGEQDLSVVILLFTGETCTGNIKLSAIKPLSGFIDCISDSWKMWLSFDSEDSYGDSRIAIFNDRYVFDVSSGVLRGPHYCPGDTSWVIHFIKMGYCIGDSVKMANILNEH